MCDSKQLTTDTHTVNHKSDLFSDRSHKWTNQHDAKF